MTKKNEKYIQHRKKHLKELRDIIFQRNELNTYIRKIRKDLNAWDNALIEE